MDIFFWLTNNPIIPQGEAIHHFRDIFDNQILYYNAPLITWIMKAIFVIFGKKYFDLQIIFINYIFFITALYFIYKIGTELKNKETGNIAMVLFALTPVVYGMSRFFGHQDWHVMVALVPNIYCLIKTKNFKYTKWSILYGISVGIGLLIKDEFLAYFFVPWIYVVIKSLLLKKYLKKIISNILISIFLGALIAGCHYFRSIIIKKILFEPVTETVPIFSFHNIYLLTMGISEYLLSPPIFLLFIISFIYFILKYKNENKWIILLWILIPCLIILFMAHRKEPEYMLGFVPVIILICSVFISKIKNSLLKKIILSLVITVCSLQFIVFFLPVNTKLFNYNYKISPCYKPVNYFSIFSNDIFHPSFITYKKSKYLSALLNYLKKNFNTDMPIFIYQFSWDIYYDGIYIYLRTNNFNNIFTNFSEIPKSDIIMYTSKCILTDKQNIFEIEKKVIAEHIRQNQYSDIFNTITFTIDYLRNNYIELYNLYDADMDRYIYILGKKTLFNKN